MYSMKRTSRGFISVSDTKSSSSSSLKPRMITQLTYRELTLRIQPLIIPCSSVSLAANINVVFQEISNESDLCATAL